VIETIMAAMGGVGSFLGGAAFRMVWGEVSAYFTKRQEHKFELERLNLMGRLDADKHGRDMESIRIQADMQVKVIEVAAQGEVDKISASAWAEAVKATTTSTGSWVIDSWNAAIRPLGATWAIAMLSANEFGWLSSPVSATTAEVLFAFLGLFVADRTLGKRGK